MTPKIEDTYTSLVRAIGSREPFTFTGRLLDAVRTLPPREAGMLLAALEAHRMAGGTIHFAKPGTDVAHAKEVQAAVERAIVALLEEAEKPPEGA